MADKPHYLADLGQTILANGYNIIPIPPGGKRPGFENWQNTHATPGLIRQWVGNGFGDAGVGITAATAPAIDLDIMDDDLAGYMQRWIYKHIAKAPLRIGQPPKRLMMFRCDAPFRKVQSRRYKDRAGHFNKVEILGDGQQFVSNHIHPDTGEPYLWVDGIGPMNTLRADLPVLTPEHVRAVIAEFEAQVAARGWDEAKSKAGLDRRENRLLPAPKTQVQGAELDADDWSKDIDLKGPVDLTPEECRAMLLLIPAFEGYPDWLDVCAAIHHQFADTDPETGLELFIDYSSRCSNFDHDECVAKWNSFQRSDSDTAKTFRYIIALASQAKREAATELRAEVEDALTAATDEPALLAAALKAKQAPFDAYTRELIAGKLRGAFKRITKLTMSVAMSRNMVRFEDDARGTPPHWMEGWCYLTDECSFYHPDKGMTMQRQAFNDAHTRHMLSKKDVLEGRAHAEILPAEAALNVYQIPVVQSRLYMPGEDTYFTVNGVPHVNTYSDRSVPAEPETYTRQEAKDVETVRAHFAHLFPFERDRELVISFFAYTVQTMKRPSFALLMQGCQGDGKTFFYTLMALMLGPENVGLVTGDLLQDRFTAWAEGVLMNVIEEVRWLGHNRHDILNRIKPFITNASVTVRRMHRDAYTVPNTAAYLLLTNHRDALPLDEGDSRYLVAQSQWQDRAKLLEFMAANPDYYSDLYAAAQRSPGAIRKWLKGWVLHPEFNPAARAPASSGKASMIRTGKGEDAEIMESVLAESADPDLSTTLLNATKLADAIADESDGVIPQTKALNKLLNDAGFTYLGRFRAGAEKARYWSKLPNLFSREGKPDPELVRKYLLDPL
jgi:hypothetical protein